MHLQDLVLSSSLLPSQWEVCSPARALVRARSVTFVVPVEFACHRHKCDRLMPKLGRHTRCFRPALKSKGKEKKEDMNTLTRKMLTKVRRYTQNKMKTEVLQDVTLLSFT